MAVCIVCRSAFTKRDKGYNRFSIEKKIPATDQPARVHLERLSKKEIAPATKKTNAHFLCPTCWGKLTFLAKYDTAKIDFFHKTNASEKNAVSNIAHRKPGSSSDVSGSNSDTSSNVISKKSDSCSADKPKPPGAFCMKCGSAFKRDGKDYKRYSLAKKVPASGKPARVHLKDLTQKASVSEKTKGNYLCSVCWRKLTRAVRTDRTVGSDRAVRSDRAAKMCFDKADADSHIAGRKSSSKSKVISKFLLKDSSSKPTSETPDSSSNDTPKKSKSSSCVTRKKSGSSSSVRCTKSDSSSYIASRTSDCSSCVNSRESDSCSSNVSESSYVTIREQGTGSNVAIENKIAAPVAPVETPIAGQVLPVKTQIPASVSQSPLENQVQLAVPMLPVKDQMLIPAENQITVPFLPVKDQMLIPAENQITVPFLPVKDQIQIPAENQITVPFLPVKDQIQIPAENQRTVPLLPAKDQILIPAENQRTVPLLPVKDQIQIPAENQRTVPLLPVKDQIQIPAENQRTVPLLPVKDQIQIPAENQRTVPLLPVKDQIQIPAENQRTVPLLPVKDQILLPAENQLAIPLLPVKNQAPVSDLSKKNPIVSQMLLMKNQNPVPVTLVQNQCQIPLYPVHYQILVPVPTPYTCSYMANAESRNTSMDGTHARSSNKTSMASPALQDHKHVNNQGTQDHIHVNNQGTQDHIHVNNQEAQSQKEVCPVLTHRLKEPTTEARRPRGMLRLIYYLLPENSAIPRLSSTKPWELKLIATHHAGGYGYPDGRRDPYACERGLTKGQFDSFLRSLYPKVPVTAEFDLYRNNRSKDLVKVTKGQDSLFGYPHLVFLRVSPSTERLDNQKILEMEHSYDTWVPTSNEQQPEGNLDSDTDSDMEMPSAERLDSQKILEMEHSYDTCVPTSNEQQPEGNSGSDTDSDIEMHLTNSTIERLQPNDNEQNPETECSKEPSTPGFFNQGPSRHLTSVTEAAARKRREISRRLTMAKIKRLQRAKFKERKEALAHSKNNKVATRKVVVPETELSIAIPEQSVSELGVTDAEWNFAIPEKPVTELDFSVPAPRISKWDTIITAIKARHYRRAFQNMYNATASTKKHFTQVVTRIVRKEIEQLMNVPDFPLVQEDNIEKVSWDKTLSTVAEKAPVLFGALKGATTSKKSKDSMPLRPNIKPRIGKALAVLLKAKHPHKVRVNGLSPQKCSKPAAKKIHGLGKKQETTTL